MDRKRCAWAGSDELYQRYHDTEWGVPVHDDVTLFEFLTLEGAQAGLSWRTILGKREAYRRAFRGFDPAAVPADRRGIAESIRGRMERAGGEALVGSAPGEGTEVELRLERPRR